MKALRDESADANRAYALIETLRRSGVRDFFVSPGNRNSFLISALVDQGDAVAVYSLFDERAAGFAALSFGKVANRPAVLCCTSGTAAAHYFPAVIEAAESKIPLLILTSDRPFHLVHAQANQVIDQQGLFGRYCRLSLNLPENANDLLYLPAQIAMALEACFWPYAGPVHINCPFGEPKIGKPDEFDLPMPYQSAVQTQRVLPDLAACAEKLKRSERPLVVVGEQPPSADLEPLVRLAKAWRVPIYADLLSGMRHQLEMNEQLACPDTDAMGEALQNYAPDLILHFGRRILAKGIDRLLMTSPPRDYIVINDFHGIADSTYRVTEIIRAQASQAAIGFGDIWPRWENIHHDLPAWGVIDGALLTEFSMASAAVTLSSMIPREHHVFLGNSMTVRTFDRFCRLNSPIICHRGVSGIEGHIASSYGAAIAHGGPVTAFLGDVAALHDLNALLLLNQSKWPIIVIVFNNHGGRIFEMLPMADNRAAMDPFMTTPHSHDFAAPAQWAGLRYAEADSTTKLAQVYTEALASGEAWLIEVTLSSGHPWNQTSR